MKKGIYSLIFVLLSSFGVSQTNYNVFKFRNYNRSLSLSVRNGTATINILTERGSVVNQSSDRRMQTRYLFQGQEYDQDVGLHFFPFRMYSSKTARFLQPDPKSQYYSPYLFVDGDPVNIVDRDGNQGKPLVLYGEESRPDRMTRKSAVVEDMEKELDAHYYPMSDFVNGDVPLDIPEWNGNIFIEAHTEDFGDIASEYYTKGEKIKLQGKYSAGVYEAATGGDLGFVQHNALSQRIADLSEVTGVPVKNVTIGGCKGGVAAKQMSKSMGKVFRKRKLTPGKVRFIGPNDNVYTCYACPAVFRDSEMGYLDSSGKILGPRPERVHMYLKDRGGSEGMTLDYRGERAQYLGDRLRFPYIEGEQLNGFVNGEIPPQFDMFMSTYEAELHPRVPRVATALREY